MSLVLDNLDTHFQRVLTVIVVRHLYRKTKVHIQYYDAECSLL